MIKKFLISFFFLCFLPLNFAFSEENGDAPNYQELFPSWERENKIQGVIGNNKENPKEKSFILDFVPTFINILLGLVSGVVIVMFVVAGLGFIYAGDDEEDIKKSKEFFRYGTIGAIFIAISYSIVKAVYFLILT